MRLATLLARWRSGSTDRARSGQILLIFALSMVVVLGMAGLAVDVGHAFERHQFVQGVATNAARAGAFEVLLNQRTKRLSDAAVVERMVATVQCAAGPVCPTTFSGFTSGLTVANYRYSSDTLIPEPHSACTDGLQGNQVYLEASYVDPTDNPVGPVGAGTMPTAAQGVKVTKVDMCVPHFFVGVLGFGNFDVASGYTVGQRLPANDVAPPGSGGGPPPTPTPTPGGSGEYSVAPFYIYANPKSTPSLYAQGASGGPTTCPTGFPACNGGDVVTIGKLDQAPDNYWLGRQSWADYQYIGQNDAQNGTPGGVIPHDSSIDGCLLPTQTSVMIGGDYFNHGGNGTGQHCATLPVNHMVYNIAVVQQTCKVGSCVVGDVPDPNCQSTTRGGYCVQVVAIVKVYIAYEDTASNLTATIAQGYIVGVVKDPGKIIAAPPLPTPTPIPPTNTPGPPL